MVSNTDDQSLIAIGTIEKSTYEESVEQLPASEVVVLGVAAGEGPDVVARIVGAAVIRLGIGELAPDVGLKGSNSPGNQTSSEQEQKTGRGGKESMQVHPVTSTVKDVTDNKTRD